MEYRINGFDQIKAFYSIVFDQRYEIKTQHISLYVFLINQNNRNNWVEWFKCPFDLAMQGACIGSKSTYYKCLSDLQDWGFIKYEKGINDYKSPKIKIEVLICTSTVPQSEPLRIPQGIPQGIPLPEQLPIHIYKLITDNLKIINRKQKAFEDHLKKFFVLSTNVKTWKNDFEIYKNDCRDGYLKLKSDKVWIEQQKLFYPNVDILKSIEKCFLNFWATEAGWKNKIKARTKDICWKTTIGNSLSDNRNKVYIDNGKSFKSESTQRKEDAQNLQDMAVEILQNAKIDLTKI